MEEALVALVLVDLAGRLALVRVALQLVDRRAGSVGRSRALALDDHERNAVDEQHDVGNDEPLRLPPGQSTRNWLIGGNVLLSGCSQSM